MEFNLRKPKRWGLRFGIVASIVPLICIMLFILVIISEGFQSIVNNLEVIYVMLGFSIFWVSLFAFVLIKMGTKNHKIIISKMGITYSGPKRKVRIKWEEIGDIEVFRPSNAPMLYIFNKNLSLEERKNKAIWLHQKGEYPKNISEELIFCEYYKELYSEIKKYYKEEIVSEYALVMGGKYEN